MVLLGMLRFGCCFIGTSIYRLVALGFGEGKSFFSLKNKKILFHIISPFWGHFLEDVV